MFLLGEKTVNQRKNEIICIHVVHGWTGLERAVKVLYHPTKINGIIEVKILEVTSMGLCGCNLKEKLECANGIYKGKI